MSVECGECEMEVRSGHEVTCSRHPNNRAQAMTTDKAPSVGELLAFLDGTGPIDGRWFGEYQGKSRYWWRKYLPLLAASPSPGAVPQGDDRPKLRTVPEDGGALAYWKQAYAESCDVTREWIARAEKAEAALASQAARMAELEAIQRVAQDFDSNERLGDADFWWNVAAMRAVELARQVDRAEAAEALLRRCMAERMTDELDAAIDALLHGAAK